jgi:hypothetical protein
MTPRQFHRRYGRIAGYDFDKLQNLYALWQANPTEANREINRLTQLRYPAKAGIAAKDPRVCYGFSTCPKGS